MRIKSYLALGIIALGTAACSTTEVRPSQPAPVEVVTLNQTVYFNSVWFKLNSAKIDSVFDPVLELNADYLMNNPMAKVQIQGNASELGGAKHNQKLALERAKAVAKDLIELGVNKNQIQVVSFGSTMPAFSNDKSGKAPKNRRADIVYISGAPASYVLDKLPTVETEDETITFDPVSVVQKKSVAKSGAITEVVTVDVESNSDVVQQVSPSAPANSSAPVVLEVIHHQNSSEPTSD